jgi:hypothetical protein
VEMIPFLLLLAPDAGFFGAFAKIFLLSILFSQIKALQPCETERSGGQLFVCFEQKNSP